MNLNLMKFVPYVLTKNHYLSQIVAIIFIQNVFIVGSKIGLIVRIATKKPAQDH